MPPFSVRDAQQSIELLPLVRQSGQAEHLAVEVPVNHFHDALHRQLQSKFLLPATRARAADALAHLSQTLSFESALCSADHLPHLITLHQAGVLDLNNCAGNRSGGPLNAIELLIDFAPEMDEMARVVERPIELADAIRQLIKAGVSVHGHRDSTESPLVRALFRPDGAQWAGALLDAGADPLRPSYLGEASDARLGARFGERVSSLALAVRMDRRDIEDVIANALIPAVGTGLSDKSCKALLAAAVQCDCVALFEGVAARDSDQTRRLVARVLHENGRQMGPRLTAGFIKSYVAHALFKDILGLAPVVAPKVLGEALSRLAATNDLRRVSEIRDVLKGAIENRSIRGTLRLGLEQHRATLESELNRLAPSRKFDLSAFNDLVSLFGQINRAPQTHSRSADVQSRFSQMAQSARDNLKALMCPFVGESQMTDWLEPREGETPDQALLRACSDVEARVLHERGVAHRLNSLLESRRIQNPSFPDAQDKLQTMVSEILLPMTEAALANGAVRTAKMLLEASPRVSPAAVPALFRAIGRLPHPQNHEMLVVTLCHHVRNDPRLSQLNLREQIGSMLPFDPNIVSGIAGVAGPVGGSVMAGSLVALRRWAAQEVPNMADPRAIYLSESDPLKDPALDFVLSVFAGGVVGCVGFIAHCVYASSVAEKRNTAFGDLLRAHLPPLQGDEQPPAA